jgi:hypothetical protein
MPRFHLAFDYPGTNGERVSGDQVVERDTIEEAAQHIARERRLKEIHIRRRYFTVDELPEIIDRIFKVEK